MRRRLAISSSVYGSITGPNSTRARNERGVTMRVVLVGGTPEHFRTYLTGERKKWSDIIQKRGIKVE